jgi:hypothetical protein
MRITAVALLLAVAAFARDIKTVIPVVLSTLETLR